MLPQRSRHIPLDLEKRISWQLLLYRIVAMFGMPLMSFNPFSLASLLPMNIRLFPLAWCVIKSPLLSGDRRTMSQDGNLTVAG